MTEPLSLRERTRLAVREEMIRCGMDLFAREGYDETTVAEVARASGMSERSFFRYFASKADLALASQEQIGKALAARLAERPIAEHPWVSIRRAFDPIVTTIDENPEGRSRRLIEMLHSTPELGHAQLGARYEWARLLTPHVASHLPPLEESGLPDPRAAAIAVSAVMSYQTAQDAWLESDGKASMAVLLDQAMDAVADIRKMKTKRALAKQA